MISHATIGHPCSAAFASISSRNWHPGLAAEHLPALLRAPHHVQAKVIHPASGYLHVTSHAFIVYQLGVSNRLTATPGDAIPLPPEDGSPLAQNLMVSASGS